MPCVGLNCANPDPGLPHNRVSYRNKTYWLCNAHQGLFNQVIRNHSGASTQQKEDAKKLYIATASAELFDMCMMALVQETARRHGNSLTWRWRMHHEHFHLSKELTYYEYKCWFGDQQKIFAGLLSAQEFLNAMANGYMVKDPGPGPNHGEFSHRLQWHMLMRIMTNDFTVPKTAEWHHTPLELYCWTGTSGYWGAVLEGVTPTGATPGDPRWVDERLRQHPVLSKTSLGRAIAKRRNKRLEMLELIAQKALEYERQVNRVVIVCHDGSFPLQNSTFRSIQGTAIAQLAKRLPQRAIVVNMHDISTLLYAWKKTGGPKGIRIHDPEDHVRAIALKVWNEEAKAMRKLGARYEDGSSRANYRFEQLSNGDYSTGSLLAHSAQCTDGDVNSRIASSRAALR